MRQCGIFSAIGIANLVLWVELLGIVASFQVSGRATISQCHSVCLLSVGALLLCRSTIIVKRKNLCLADPWLPPLRLQAHKQRTRLSPPLGLQQVTACCMVVWSWVATPRHRGSQRRCDWWRAWRGRSPQRGHKLARSCAPSCGGRVWGRGRGQCANRDSACDNGFYRLRGLSLSRSSVQCMTKCWRH